MPRSPVSGARARRLSRLWRQGAGGAAALAVLLGGCSSEPGGGGDVPQVPAINLVADTNRNGVLDADAADEEAGEDAWDAQRGAVVLANLDDDEGNNNAASDASTEGVDGDDDVADLSPLLVRAWPAAPNGARGLVTIEAGEDKVHLFQVTGSPERASSYTRVDMSEGLSLDTAQLRAGVPLALEATELMTATGAGAWDGRVRLRLTVSDAAGKELGSDAVELRVAPLLFQWNTAKTERVFYTEGGSETQTLADGIHAAAAAAQGVDVTPVKLSARSWDPWTQDFFDVGTISRPGPGGTPVVMHIAVRSAQPDRPAGDQATKKLLGPGWGRVYVTSRGRSYDSHGYSMNSFGNWDVVPPYTKGSERFPLGRNIWGSGDTEDESPDPVFVDFVRAQGVQPPIVVDTTWLSVGHVDEFLSFVQANNARGWQLLAARPSMSRQMLQQLQQAGHGSKRLFEGKEVYDLEDPSWIPRTYAADASIDEILADADRMAASQESEVKIDAQVALLKDEIGLSDSEITYLPILFEEVFGAMIAYQPGTVNLLHVDGHLVVPKPFGPRINGADPFETDITDRLGKLGLQVVFADDWDTYHRNMGEVHCGSNVARTLDLAWWESGR